MDTLSEREAHRQEQRDHHIIAAMDDLEEIRSVSPDDLDQMDNDELMELCQKAYELYTDLGLLVQWTKALHMTRSRGGKR